ncbi:MAG: hypothetical protein AAF801_15765 [Pseudomonadota bacterium]
MSELDKSWLSYLTLIAVTLSVALMPLQFGSDGSNSAAPFIFMATVMLWGAVINQLYRYKSRRQAIALGIVVALGYVVIVLDSLFVLADRFGMMDYV